jgi:membrane fusion protein (multidrug efflux system)
MNLPILSAWGVSTLVLLGLCCGCERSTPEGSPPAAPPVAVSLVRPVRGDITRHISLPGNIVAYQQATLYAKVAGYLKTITVDKGDRVQEGQLLADLEVPELLADQAKYNAEVAMTQIDFKRVSEAQKQSPDLVVPQTVDNARGTFDVAKANLARVETLLRYTKITAPFAGTITARFVDPGAFIPAATSGSTAQNAALVTLADFTRVRIQVPVPEPEVPHIVNGLPVTVTVDELPGRVFPGTVTRFANALEDGTKTMLTEIEIPNPDAALRPGMYALVQIGVERKTNALKVPVEALLVEKAKTSVFTVVGGSAKKLPVKVGFSDGHAAEILDGLKPDEPLILVGKQVLADNQAVTVTEAK